MIKNAPANARDSSHVDSIPGLRRSPGEGNGNPGQYSCLEKPTNVVVNSRKQLSTRAYINNLLRNMALS